MGVLRIVGEWLNKSFIEYGRLFYVTFETWANFRAAPLMSDDINWQNDVEEATWDSLHEKHLAKVTYTVLGGYSPFGLLIMRSK